MTVQQPAWLGPCMSGCSSYMTVQQPACPGPCMCSMASRSPSSRTFLSRLPTSCMLRSGWENKAGSQVKTGVEGEREEGGEARLGKRGVAVGGIWHERGTEGARRMPADCMLHSRRPSPGPQLWRARHAGVEQAAQALWQVLPDGLAVPVGHLEQCTDRARPGQQNGCGCAAAAWKGIGGQLQQQQASPHAACCLRPAACALLPPCTALAL